MSGDIWLTTEAHNLAVEVGRERMEAAPVNLSAGELRGTYSRLDIEVVGVKAEIAAATYYGVEYNLEVRPERRSAEPDIVVGELTLNVKGTRYARGSRPHLFVPDHNASMHGYVLVYATPSGYRCEMLGYATRDMLENETPKKWNPEAPPSRRIPMNRLLAPDLPMLLRGV